MAKKFYTKTDADGNIQIVATRADAVINPDTRQTVDVDISDINEKLDDTPLNDLQEANEDVIASLSTLTLAHWNNIKASVKSISRISVGTIEDGVAYDKYSITFADNITSEFLVRKSEVTALFSDGLSVAEDAQGNFIKVPMASSSQDGAMSKTQNDNLAALTTWKPNAEQSISTHGNELAELGYFVCDTAADVRDKVVTSHIADGHRQGLSQKVKMTYATTVVSRYVHNGAAHGLYFEGKIANAENSWNAGDILEIFCDGANAYAKVWNSESIRLNTLQQKVAGVENKTNDISTAESEQDEDVISFDDENGNTVVEVNSRGLDAKAIHIVNGEDNVNVGDTLGRLIDNATEMNVVKETVDELSESITKKKVEETTDSIDFTEGDDDDYVAHVDSEGVHAKAFYVQDSKTGAKKKVGANKDLKMLTIGHSFVSDVIAYVDPIVLALGIDVSDLAIYECYRGSSTYKGWVQTWNDDYSSTEGNVSYSIEKKLTNGITVDCAVSSSSSSNGAAFRKAIKEFEWDVIVLPSNSGMIGDDSAQEQFTELMSIIRTYQPSAQIYIVFNHISQKRTTGASADYGKTADAWVNACERLCYICDDHDIDMVIPSSTALENLRMTKYNGNSDSDTGEGMPTHNLTRDDHHQGTGLARLTSAMTFYEKVLAPRYGVSINTLSSDQFNDKYNSKKSTYDKRATETYPNGCISVTDNNIKYAKAAAIAACDSPCRLSDVETIVTNLNK